MDNLLIDEIGIIDNFEGQPVSPGEMGIQETSIGGGDTNSEAKERFPEIQAWTFAEAEARQKGFGRDFVLGSLNDDLKGVDGKKALFVKTHLDQAMPDGQEREISKSPEELVNLHTQTSQMIVDNLRVFGANLSEEQKQYIRSQRIQYFGRLQRNSSEWKQYVEQTAAGQNPIEFERLTHLEGLNLRQPDGSAIDIADFSGDKAPNIRSNIRIQTEITGQFIHWETDSVSRAKLSGQEVGLGKRIYLNPRTSELVGTFSSIMHSFNEAGISVQGKMLDRSFELANQIRSSEPRPVRADSIVLVIKNEDADRVLSMVLSTYRNDPSVFEGRPTPKVPLKIAPGIAVGDEPEEAGVSLTSSRAKVIEDALLRTRQRLRINKGEKIPQNGENNAVQVFNSTFAEIARTNGVNPNNLAFNLPKAS